MTRYRSRIERTHPDYSPYMVKETTEGRKRVCWNSWIAPHNFEGFLLNIGDLLVKSGDWQTAQKIHSNARLSRTYTVWTYQPVLEDRDCPSASVPFFNAQDGASKPRIMINSEFSCMACHQQ